MFEFYHYKKKTFNFRVWPYISIYRIVIVPVWNKPYLSTTFPFMKHSTAGSTRIFSFSTKYFALSTLILANLVSKYFFVNAWKSAKMYCKSKDFHMENISFILLVTNKRTRCVNSAKSHEKQKKHFLWNRIEETNSIWSVALLSNCTDIPLVHYLHNNCQFSS